MGRRGASASSRTVVRRAPKGPPSSAFFIERALLPIFEFGVFGAFWGQKQGARKGPVNGPEAVLRVKFCDRRRAGGVAPLTKPGTAPDFRAARGALLTLGVEAQAGHLFPVGSWLEVRDHAHGNRHAQFERVRVHESDDPRSHSNTAV